MTVICFLKDHKLQLFFETYHAPFTIKHRYWTGLLFIIRAILYLVAAANVSNNPQISLSAIVFTMICILFLIAYINIKMYTKMPINFLETCFILNILLFSVFTWYSLSNSSSHQKTAAYTSVLIAFILLTLIILYHVFMYTTVSSTVKKTKLSRMMNKFFFKADPAVRYGHHWWPLHDVATGSVKAILTVIYHCLTNSQHSR